MPRNWFTNEQIAPLTVPTRALAAERSKTRPECWVMSTKRRPTTAYSRFTARAPTHSLLAVKSGQ